MGVVQGFKLNCSSSILQARTCMSSMPEIPVPCIDPDRCMGGPVMVSGFYERRLVLGEAQEATRQISNMLSQVCGSTASRRAQRPAGLRQI